MSKKLTKKIDFKNIIAVLLILNVLALPIAANDPGEKISVSFAGTKDTPKTDGWGKITKIYYIDLYSTNIDNSGIASDLLQNQKIQTSNTQDNNENIPAENDINDYIIIQENTKPLKPRKINFSLILSLSYLMAIVAFARQNKLSWLMLGSLALIPAITGLQIIHNPSIDVNVTENSAIINWKTDLPANSRIDYDIDENINESASDANVLTEHSMNLINLLSGAKYFYKIISNDSESGIKTFTTKDSNESFMSVNSLPSIVNSNRVFVSGITRPSSRIVIFVNKDTNPVPKINSKAGKDGKFNESVFLDSARQYDGIIGNNLIEINSWNELGRKDTKIIPIIVDTVPPKIIISEIPDEVGQQLSRNFSISGLTEINSSLTLFVNNQSRGAIAITENGTFNAKASLGDSGIYLVKIVAVDPAGNNNSFEKNITVDTTIPTLIITSDRKAHFKLFKIIGKTEPYARVSVTNIGEYATLDEYFDQKGNITRTRILVDPTGLILGTKRNTDADKAGNFELMVNLLSSFKGLSALNRFIFEITDKAGNKLTTPEVIEYLPDCGVWKAGLPESYPISIYTTYWNAGDINGNAYFPIEYMGSGTPKIQTVIASIEHGQGTNDMNVETGALKKWYDDKEKKLFVNVPIIIKQNSKRPSELPDKIDVQLKVDVTYMIESQGAEPCSVYPKVTFDIQKPENLLKRFKPSQIKKKIEQFDELIKYTQQAEDLVKKATIVTSALCGGYYMYKWVGGSDTDLTDLYYVCDRVMCPSIPPKADKYSFNRYGTENNIWSRFLDDTNKTEQRLEFIPADKLNEVPGLSTEDNKNLQDTKRLNPNCTYYVLEQIKEYPKSQINQFSDWREQVPTRNRYKCIDTPTYEKVQTLYNSTQNLSDFIPTSFWSPGPPQYDNTKCLLNKERTNTDPAEDFLDSIQCVCLPGIYGHLQGYRQIFEGAKQCLIKAYNGEMYGGACERLLAQYVCDGAYLLIGGFFKYVPVFDSGKTDLQNRNNRRTQISDSLKNRYGNIIDQRTGLSTDRVVNKVCVAAISADWSILEGALTNFVEEIPIDPMVKIDAESMPMGYNPLTGKLSIAYNLYVGIIPGGDSSYSLELQCDPNYKNSDSKYNFCGKSSDQRVTINGVPIFMNKQTPMFDQNIAFFDNDAKYWYNKMVLTVKHKAANGDQITKPIVTPIRKKGTINYQCTFSMLDGFSCKKPFPDQIGNLEFLTKGSYASPTGITFFPGNKVSVVAKINNHFDKKFVISTSISSPPGQSGSPPINANRAYSIMGEQEDEQVYNLLIWNFGEQKQEGTVQQSTFSPITETIEVNDGTKITAPNTKKVVLSITLKNPAETIKLLINETGQFKQENGGTYTLYKFNNNNITKIEILSYETTDYTSQSLKTLLVGGKTFTIGVLSSVFQSSYPKGQWTLTTDIMDDPGGDGTGDTEIQYDGNSQKKIYSIKYENRVLDANKMDTSCANAPTIELIEPVGNIMSAKKGVPIGVNVYDDCNNIKAIYIKVRSSNKDNLAEFVLENSEAKWKNNGNDVIPKEIETIVNRDMDGTEIAKKKYKALNFSAGKPDKDYTECGLPGSNLISLSHIPTDNEPPFFEFLWNPGENLNPKEQYFIEAVVWDWSKDIGTESGGENKMSSPVRDIEKSATNSKIITLDPTFPEKSAFAFIGSTDKVVKRRCS